MRCLIIVSQIFIGALLCGCAGLLGADFDRATRLVSVRLGADSHITSDMALPAGAVELVVAVPNQHCHAISPDTVIKVKMTGHMRTIETAIKASTLTWSFGQGSCHAYGYIYDSAVGLGKTLEIPRDVGNVRIEVETSSVPRDSDRILSLWVIYGGRVPTGRLFGSD